MIPEDRAKAKRQLCLVIDEHLAPLGFSRQKLSWARTLSEVTQQVELRRSQYGFKFWIYLHCWIKELSIKAVADLDPSWSEPDHFRYNLAELRNWDSQKIDDYLDLEKRSVAECLANLNEVLSSEADALLEDSSTISGIETKLLTSTTFKPFVNGHLINHLEMRKPI